MEASNIEEFSTVMIVLITLYTLIRDVVAPLVKARNGKVDNPGDDQRIKNIEGTLKSVDRAIRGSNGEGGLIAQVKVIQSQLEDHLLACKGVKR
jgi:hypothetical protein